MRRRINPKEGASIVAVGGRERRNRNVGRHVGVMTLYAILTLRVWVGGSRSFFQKLHRRRQYGESNYPHGEIRRWWPAERREG